MVKTADLGMFISGKKCMEKAVYYARVSTSLQEERGTIESQKSELIQQIKKDGNILIREYSDNGWSGTRLDRPALDELRNDVKTNLFDVVYFLDSDRIARDSTYQNIIISELLKYGKKIIIRGKNYIDNPENKFTLTVMGAVNELEKAKIVERLMRGRKEKARRGKIVDGGQLFGYSYIKRTDKTDGYYKINEEHAEVVRLIYETYANTDTSITGLIKFLEKRKIKTAQGNYFWGRSSISRILKNTSYFGLHYFNRAERIESDNKNTRYARNRKTKTRPRDESEWIPVPIPAIISEELFNRVQEKIKRNQRMNRGTDEKYLLSGLIKCGICDHTYTGAVWNTKKRVYKCNYREKNSSHIPEVIKQKCDNYYVFGEDLENAVWDVVIKKVLQPSIIKKYIDILRDKKSESRRKLEVAINSLNAQIENINKRKMKLLDLYSDGLVDRDNYQMKIEELDDQAEGLNNRLGEAKTKIELLDKRKEINENIGRYCQTAKKKARTLDQKQKRFFLQQIIKKIVFLKDRITIIGYFPIVEISDKTDEDIKHCSYHTCYRSDKRFRKI